VNRFLLFWPKPSIPDDPLSIKSARFKAALNLFPSLEVFI
jgi:hypothetical protein